MTWASWGDFWAMGGYAPFVWGSYGVTVAAIAVEIWLVRQRRQRALAELARAAARRQGIGGGDETKA